MPFHDAWEVSATPPLSAHHLASHAARRRFPKPLGMSVLFYRPSLDFASGAGQLIAMQLRALRAAGEHAEIACARGAHIARRTCGKADLCWRCWW